MLKLLELGCISDLAETDPKLLELGFIPDLVKFPIRPKLLDFGLISNCPKLLDSEYSPCQNPKLLDFANSPNHHKIFNHANMTRRAPPSVAAGQACSSTNGEGIYPNFNQASDGLTLNSS